MTNLPTVLHGYYFPAIAVGTEMLLAFMMLIVALLVTIAGFAFVIARKNNNMLEYKANANRKLIRHTVLLQEAERKRIASAIHDGFCSRLSIIKLMLHNTGPEGNVPEEIFTRIDEAYHEARILSHHLDSPVLERMGLLDAMRDYIRPLYGVLNIEVHVLQVFTERMAKHIELHLFRIFQEAVTNIIRHANASIVQIDIHFSRRLAALRITDNGRGFEAKNSTGGAGLKNIRLRTALLGGNYRMRSEPEQGTSLLVMVPMEKSVPRKAAFPVTVYDDDFDHEDVTLYLDAEKQFLYANGTHFIFSTRRRRTPFYKRYRKHHSSKDKTQGTLRG
ncbi:MAG: hypothetical protein KDD04_04410 [Sinomicrobium sp.]|nr:hypothetical protein [Sinomicrobium sp.]